VNPRTDHRPADHTVTKETANVTSRHSSTFSNSNSSPRGAALMRRLALSAAVSVATLLGAGAAFAAPAQAASPWWHLSSGVRPAGLAAGEEGILTFRATDIGDASATLCSPVAPGTGAFTGPGCEEFERAEPPGSGEFELTPIVLDIKLPPGIAVKQLGAGEPDATLHKLPEKNLGNELCAEPAPGEIRCSYGPPEASLLPFEYLELSIAVETSGTGGSASFTASGGGAEEASLTRQIPLGAAPARPAFGAEEDGFAVRPEGEGGALDTRAGSHPFQLTTDLALNQNLDPLNPPALTRNLAFELPPGLLANATAVASCSEADFLTRGEGGGFDDKCPGEAAVGVVLLNIHQTFLANQPVQTYPVPVFNLIPGQGEPARFGFYFAGIPVTIDFSLRSNGDYGATAHVANVTQSANFISESLTIWGTPGDPIHNASRGWGCLIGRFYQAFGKPECIPSTQTHPKPFLQLPISCETPFAASIEGVSWPNRESPAGALLARREYRLSDSSGAPVAISACDKVPFEPTIAAESSRSASSPTGLAFDIDFEDPGIENENGIVNSQIKRAVITLPPGFTTNPAVANGLGACTTAQYEAETLTAQGCPESSKVGTVEIESPLVEPKIDGSLYVAKQGDNVNGNLLTVYLVAKSPELGVIVKQALKVTPNPQTGRLTSEVDDVPRLPFSHLHLAFRSGPRAPLITPATCGRYAAEADLYPWSNPSVPLHREATLTVDSGNGGPCATGESQLPDHPTLSAGTLSPIAGAYSPFVFEVKREDGEQRLSTISATLPEGLLGKLAGVKECANAQIAQAESRSGEGQGALERSSPSCPATSQVGVVTVGAGVGSQPYYVQGNAYLAGPYKGAPLSLAIITPAVVGPFDLGTIVVRTALHVDESTTQITAVSDPIPTIVHGLPTVVQSISLEMNRPNFTLNPTSCEPKLLTGSATSTLGDVAPLSQRFQVDACNALAFKPTLKLSFSGQAKRTGNPAVKAVLTQPEGNNANIARTSVVLPKGMLIAEAHVNNPCTRVQFNSGPVPGEACPPKSVLGHAKVWTPLLEAPEEGPVYFRSNGGERELPDLVVALRGQIPVQLVGFIDSVGKKGAEVRRVRTRFQSVPDAPISRFELKLSGGRKGLLENSQNLCKSKQLSKFQLTGQNGATYDTEPAVAVACGKKKSKNAIGKGGH
jgi:hypothetical protein